MTHSKQRVLKFSATPEGEVVPKPKEEMGNEEEVNDIPVEELEVNILDEEGQPVDETTLTEEQISFCAKTAYKTYKKFTAKRKKFSAESDSIQVTLPKDMENYDVDSQVDKVVDAMADYEEPVIEDDVDGKGVIVAEITEEGTKQFSSDDSDDDDKDLEDLLESAIENYKEAERVAEIPKEVEELENNGVQAVKSFSATGDVDLNCLINESMKSGAVESVKLKMFASTSTRKR